MSMQRRPTDADEWVCKMFEQTFKVESTDPQVLRDWECRMKKEIVRCDSRVEYGNYQVAVTTVCHGRLNHASVFAAMYHMLRDCSAKPELGKCQWSARSV
jgi:hypothetical protein